MSLGGGTFQAQNKSLPGSYVNYVSASKASATLSDRGVAAMPIELDWGVDGAVFTVTSEQFQKESLKWFGYAFDHEKLKGLRDLFQNIQTGHFYRLLNGGSEATNTFCTAKYKGILGNSLKTIVAVNVDAPEKMDVMTYLDTKLMDKQTVLPNTNNLQENDWVVWKSNVALTETSGLPLTSGSNGSAITGTEYQQALNAFESVSFNALGCVTESDSIKELVVQYTKRLRETMGVKFQAVLYKKAADYEGVIPVENPVQDEGVSPASMVYWVTGAQAGCLINKSLTNREYKGSFTPNTTFTQAELKEALKSSKFIFHKVGDKVKVLEDINSLSSLTTEKSEDFRSNQTIRVMDQVANDTAVLFNTKYLGIIPNDEDGRDSLWNDIVTQHRALERLRAIENFNPKELIVSAGATKKAVVVENAVTPVNAMAQLYMTLIIQ